ncbi:hypothetical protein GCM10027290_17990 [Micromonospora sonneratiae]
MPRGVRIVVAAAVCVFVYGAVVHLVDVFGGRADLPPSTPNWLALYFVSLTVLDPAAALLLVLRRVEGLVLGCVVLTTDAAANAYANYLLDDAGGVTPGRIGQAVISMLAIALAMAAPRVAPWLGGDGAQRREHDRRNRPASNSR